MIVVLKTDGLVSHCGIRVLITELSFAETSQAPATQIILLKFFEGQRRGLTLLCSLILLAQFGPVTALWEFWK